MAINHDYGLELTNNSKVGWAFSLPRAVTCVNATAICRKLCYGNGIRYQSDAQKAKRARNFRTVEFLLNEGGPDLLAENLSAMVEHARPRDWVAARIKKVSTRLPWTLRIHDVGDFHSIEYVRAWIAVAKKFPQCSFWFYTRSFVQSDLLDVLTELAQLDNCQGWLSLDSDNYTQGILAKCKSPAGVWKIALLQDRDLFPEVIPAIDEVSQTGEVVNFPYHQGGRHVVPLRDSILMTCPAVVGTYRLKSSAEALRPCQQCRFCLP